MDAPQIVEVTHGGAQYRALVVLRDEVLRAPLGLAFSDAELAAESAHRHFAAYTGDTLQGTVMLAFLSAERAQIRQMAVRPALQGQGVGRVMLRYVEAWAAQAGIRELVAEARMEALGFYEKLGYLAVGPQYIKVTVPHRDIVKSLI